MKEQNSFGGQTEVGSPPKVLRPAKRAPLLPPTAMDRHRCKLENWRHALWCARHKFLVLPGPQYRELIRKMLFSMEKAGFRKLMINLEIAIFTIWFFTGSVQKLEEFIVAVFNGKLFLLNPRILFSQNTPIDLPDIELIRRLLLYDPSCYPNGCSENAAWNATPLFTWMGTPPEVKPWIEEWGSEMEKTRRRAAAEIGKEAADALWSDVCGVKRSATTVRHSQAKELQSPVGVAYW